MKKAWFVIALLVCSTSIASGFDWGKLKKAGKAIKKAGQDVERFEKKTRSVRKAGAEVKRAKKGLSPSEEYFVGRSVAAGIFSRYQPHPNAMLQGYVQAVGQVVANASARPELFRGYHFTVLDTDDINAMAAPGGFIFVTRGLLERMRDEDELACALAHEIGHIVARHGVVAIEKDRRKKANLKFFGEVGKTFNVTELKKATKFFGSHVGKIVDKVITGGYSRQQEFAADQLGVGNASDAGYDPLGLERVLAAIEGGRGGWVHANPQVRIRKIQQLDIGPASWHSPPSVRVRRFNRVMRSL